MKRYPLQRPAVCAVAFFACGLFCAAHGGAMAWLLVAAAVCLAFARGGWLRRALPLGLIFFCCGFVWMQVQSGAAHALDDLRGERASFAVQVVEVRTGHSAFDGRVRAVNGVALQRTVPVRVQRAFGDERPLRPGAVVSVQGRLRSPEGPHNPGGFDEHGVLRGRGMAVVLEARAAAQLVQAPPAWRMRLDDVHTALTDVLRRGLSADGAVFIQAVLLGETEHLHKDFYALGQQLGVVHIFAVSGLHVGFILAFMLFFVRRFHCSHHWATLLPLGGLLLGYVLMTGAHASAVRAVGMAFIGFLALRSHRHRDPWTILALAALIILVLNPFALWQVGFQLSFAITAGLIGFLPPLTEWLSATALPKSLAAGLSVALVAELVSAPFVAYYFHLFTPVSVPVNLLLVPFVALTVFCSLAAILLSLLLPALTVVVWWPVQVLLDLLFAFLRGPGRWLAGSHFYVGSPSLHWLLLCGTFLVVLAVLMPWLGRRRRPWLKGALLMIFCVLVANGYQPAPSSLALGVLDVGQGSGAVWQSEQGEWFVFDTGPGADEMAAYLRAAGVNEIAAMVISHGDTDHFRGAAHVLRDFRVRRLFISDEALQGAEAKRIAPHLRNTEVHTVSAPCEVSAGDLSLFLRIAGGQTAGPNSHQLVALLEEGPWRVLFPGDVDAKAFSALPWQHALDICLAPHHGSRYSWDRATYERLTPKLVLISCGRGNRFGHPHGDVLQGLAELAVPIQRTDEQGGVFLHRRAEALQAVSWHSSEDGASQAFSNAI